MQPLTLVTVISTSSLWEEAQAELQQLPVRVGLELAAIEDPVGFFSKVEQIRPDVVLLDPSRISDGLPDIIRQIRNTSSAPSVVIICDKADPNDIISAIRAGAHEYVYPPVAKNLREALDRISHDRAESASRSSSKGGRNIGFLSVKGGCGATTLACHAATDIARLSGKDTLLADFDFASGLIRVLMQARSRYSILDAVNNVQRLDPSYWQGLISNGYQGLEIIAGTGGDLLRQLPAGHDIRHVLRFVRGQYDFTVADLGHGLEPHTLAAIEELDSLVLVSTMEMPALQQAKALFRFIRDAGFPRDKVHFVLNRIPRRGEISPADIESVLSAEVYAVVPNDFKALDLAYSNGRLLPEDHAVRQAIARFSAKLAGVQPEENKRKFKLFGISL